MISLINASAFGSEKEGSTSLTAEDCQDYMARYAASKVRLWAYNPSLSRLALRIDRPVNEGLSPIDLVFVGSSDVRCPVHWILGKFEIIENQEPTETKFAVPSAGVSFSASDLTIVVQNEWPHRCWELENYGKRD
jgi:hypothetical protein